MQRFNFLSHSRFCALATFVLAGVMLAFTSVARAGSSATVVYSTPLERIEGPLAILYTYTLTVTAPSNLPVGSFSVTMDAVLDASKSGAVDPVLADTYVKFLPNPLKFTRLTMDPLVPLPTATVVVTLDVPFDAPPGVYSYQIYTRGWTNDVTGVPHAGFSDGGTAINMTATPPGAPPPPTVSIDAPTDDPSTVPNEALFTVTAADMPKTIALRISATATVAAPILNENGIVAYIKKITPTDPAPGLPGDLILGLSVTRPDLLKPWNAVATKNLVITQPGTYALTAHSFNAIGSAEDNDTFRVNVVATKPQVVIDSPKTNYIYRLGDPALVVPYKFTGTSFWGGLRTLGAKVDGASVASYPTGSDTLGQLVESRTVNLTYTYAAAGSYTYALRADASDDNGTADPAIGSFTVTVPAPAPEIDYVPHAGPPAVNLAGGVFILPPGATTLTLPWRFNSSSKNDYVVDEVKVEQGTTVIQTTFPKTPTATNTGTITVGAGTHSLKATMWTGGSARLSDVATVSFEVKAQSNVPPTVVIDTPPPGSVYTRVSGGPALSIPLTFTGTSQTSGAYIKKLTASLNGVPLSVTPTPATLEVLKQKSPQGSATMSVTNAGTYTITVTAEDAYGIATTTRTFVVNIVQGRTICGDTFFDVDFDGYEDSCEFGLSGVTVKLINAAGQVVATDVTDACGNYSFCNIGPGAYRVVATAPIGLKNTTSIDRTITVAGSNVCVPKMGFGLDFDDIRGMRAGGYTIGFWKNNLDKAIAGKTNGTQVSKTTLQCYTSKIGDFALSPYDNISMKTAASIMGSNSSKTTDLLSKQLVASEYNYQNGAYLNGNKTLTFLFVYWGEYVLTNSSKYSSTYLTRAKDWFDAYNNTHGGALNGPATP